MYILCRLQVRRQQKMRKERKRKKKGCDTTVDSYNNRKQTYTYVTPWAFDLKLELAHTYYVFSVN